MSTTTPQLEQVDVRGPRFAAWVTAGVLVLTLILSTFSLPVATVVLALQAIVFVVGAVLGPKRSPYGQIFGKLVAPRISPVSEREPVAPLRFAQFVGFVFALAGTAGISQPCDDRRHRCHRLRLVRGPAQRRVRHLPRLPDLPARRKAAKYRPRDHRVKALATQPC